MKNTLVFIFIWIATMQLSQAQYKTFIKTNILNIPITPSIHLEQQIGAKSSLQLDFHRAKFTFISLNNLLNTAITFRKYIGKSSDLQGLYVGPAIGMQYDYKQGGYVDSIYLIGNGYLGAGGKFGWQKTVFSDRLVLDANLGIITKSFAFRNFQYDFKDVELRAMVGFGFKISK